MSTFPQLRNCEGCADQGSARRALAHTLYRARQRAQGYSHFTIPRWFAYKGGWQNPAAADLCDKATKHLGDLVRYASTFNEPDIPQLLNWFVLPDNPGKSMNETLQENLGKVRKQLNAPDFASFFLGDGKQFAMA